MVHGLQDLFLQVADLTPEERMLYFESNATPASLRDEVESLLRFDTEVAQSSMTGMVAATIRRLADSTPGPHEGDCGPYKLVKLLGQGGMGSVYLGERTDGELDLRVAIKFVRGLAAPGFQERFLKERQILASLNDPGIARLLDAGRTGAGQPYLVMEYVEGTPIDVYCEGRPLREKLQLFLKVCDAVAYLHRNLVIHRDLKPSNILVETSGQPKVLDFGIAKMLDEGADLGVTADRILTPDYASPEQVRGTARTTATDIYSLGVLLHRLVTGRLPYVTDQPRTPESQAELICNGEPQAPSEANPALPRDLDFVVAKALRKETAERYPVVEALAADVGAVLESRPVKARSGNRWYLMRMFVRRRWLPLAAAAAVLLSLSIGLYVANRERTIAQNRFAQLRKFSNQILALDRDAHPSEGGTKVRQQIVASSMEYLDGLGREVKGDPELTLEIANGHMMTAQIQGVPVFSNLGQFKEADQSLAKAAALVEEVLARSPERPDALLLAAHVEEYRMIVADTLKDWGAVATHASRSAGYVASIASGKGVSAEQQAQASQIAMHIGQAQMNTHHYAEAVAYLKRAMELAKASSAPPVTMAQGLSVLANALRQSGDLEGALGPITEARAIIEKVQFDSEVRRILGLYAILTRQGLILGQDDSVSLGRTDEAVEPFAKAFELVDAGAAKDPADAGLHDRIGTVGRELGDVLRHSDPARSLAIYDRALARIREGKQNQVRLLHESKLLSHSSYPLRSLHRVGEARQRIEQSFQILHSLDNDSEFVGLIGGEWDNAMRARADLEAGTGERERARETLLELLRRLLEKKPHPDTDLPHAYDMSRTYSSLARIDAALGLREEASKYDSMRLELWRAWDKRLPNNWYVRQRLVEKSSTP